MELIRRILALSPKAKTVCDPFSGSGTVGVACAPYIRVLACEQETRYFHIAVKRITNAWTGGPLLAPVTRNLFEEGKG